MRQRTSLAAAWAACAALAACGGGKPGDTTDTTGQTVFTAGTQQDQPPAAPPPSPAPVPSPAPTPAPAPTPTPTTAPVPPKAAAVAYGALDDAQIALAGHFQLAVLNMYPSLGKARMQGTIDRLRALNPAIKLAQYVEMSELPASASTTSDLYAAVQATNTNDWWLHDAGGAKVQWTTVFGSYDLNPTAWGPTNANGQKWPQWKAQADQDSLLGQLSGLDYVFVDNVWSQPRTDADWMRNGTNQSRNDPTVQAALRNAYVSYFSALRSLNPSLKVMGNTDNDLGSVEYKGQLEGGFLECMIGKSWSIETWGGWAKMMTYYRGVLANTRSPHDVVFQVCGATADPATLRYGMASALLEDGYIAYTVNGVATAPWFDEYAAPLGSPAEAPPTAPLASGAWMRRYSNGLVLANPTSGPVTVSIGAGYRHLLGTQDPSVNNGQPESVVTLPARSGLLMVKG